MNTKVLIKCSELVLIFKKKKNKNPEEVRKQTKLILSKYIVIYNIK